MNPVYPLTVFVFVAVIVIWFSLSTPTDSPEYFVLFENALETVPMVKHQFNVRRFNSSPMSTSLITFDHKTSTISVPPGTYVCTAYSKVSAPMSNEHMPGYCALIRHSPDSTGPITKKDVVIYGSLADAEYGQLSHIQSMLEVEQTQAFQLAHQCLIPEGQQAYLQVSGNESITHIFASIRLVRIR
jgi:hypothetical protein